MFGKRHPGRKAANPIYILFRLILSLIMFAVLLGGIYSAYKHFSSLDPLKADPGQILSELLASKTPKQLLTVLSSIKLTQGLSDKINQKVLSESSAPSVFRFLLITDSHSDNVNLTKAISQAKQNNPDLAFIIGLGDYTNVGTLDELKSAKIELDRAGLRYFLIAGDHDLWDSRNQNLPAEGNFKQIFGPLYQAFNYHNFKFLLLDNSDNYIGINPDQQKWITDQLEKATNENIRGIFVFIATPLFHPSSDHYMGKVDKDLKVQAETLIYQLKVAGVKKIFSGDIHYFSEYEEPVTKLPMVTVGAIVTDRNPQTPRYAIVSVFDDGSTRVDDVEIK